MKKPRIVTKNGLIAAVDVGSSKICCFIARLADDGKPNVVGIGHQISRGVRQGAIIDMEQGVMGCGDGSTPRPDAPLTLDGIAGAGL